MKKKQEDVITESKKDFGDVFQIKEKRDFTREEIQSIYAQLSEEEQTVVMELYPGRSAKTTSSIYYSFIHEIWCEFLGWRLFRDKSIFFKWSDFLIDEKTRVHLGGKEGKKLVQVNKDFKSIIGTRGPIIIHSFGTNAELSDKDKALLQAEFLRSNGIKVPTSRTINRIIENLWEIGFLTKRVQPTNVPSKSKVYWAIRPPILVLLKQLWGSKGK